MLQRSALCAGDPAYLGSGLITALTEQPFSVPLFGHDLNHRLNVLIVGAVKILLIAVGESNETRAMLKQNVACRTVLKEFSHVKHVAFKGVHCHPLARFHNGVGVGLRRRNGWVAGTVFDAVLEKGNNDISCVKWRD